MKLLAKLNGVLRGDEGVAVTALADLQRELRAVAAMQPRPDDWIPLATVPVLLDHADAETLGEAARMLTTAVRDDPAVALYGDLDTAMRELRTPAALWPFIRAEIPYEVVVTRSDFLLGPGGWQANEINVCAGLGGLRVDDYDACVYRQPLLRNFLAAHGYQARSPMDALARAVHRRCEKLGGGSGRPLLAVVDWEGFDVSYRQDHLGIAELYAARGFETVVCHHRELRYQHGRLWVHGRPVDVVHREFLLEDMPQDPDSALPVLAAAVEGAIVLATGFRAEWQGQKIGFGLLHQAAGRGLLPPDTVEFVRRRIPPTWLLTPELLAEPDSPLPARTDLVLKPSIGSMSQGVRLGADMGDDEFRTVLGEAAANVDDPHVLQRLIPPVTVPFPHLNDARDTLSFPDSQLSIGWFVVDDEPAGAWSKVCPRSFPTVINYWNEGQFGSVWHPVVPAGPPEADGGTRW
ncbi:ATP-grasp domain-containing protein [Plantactinospora endophytica]|uniref:Circularly permuted type 2 ATP-grasp protein n=1 Tax=Plantactinospora endophytica TaxID=673535 RepID=A0ABQ4DUX8_9ACTN|nr:hypothetical protein [Plantactinospora endophytica]GIG86262.1 hypothetical protein Pen02_11980 [Plantactinospora endophytica]